MFITKLTFQFTLETPPISPLEYVPQSPKLPIDVLPIQRVKLVPIDKKDVSHTKYIFAKADSVKQVYNIQKNAATEIRQTGKNGKTLLHT